MDFDAILEKAQKKALLAAHAAIPVSWTREQFDSYYREQVLRE